MLCAVTVSSQLYIALLYISLWKNNTNRFLAIAAGGAIRSVVWMIE